MSHLCIPLCGKRGGVALVSESAHALVDGYRWYLTKGGYVFSPKVGLMHRRLMAAEAGEEVDHRNFRRVDNRYENLRCCLPAQNRVRTRKKNTPWPYKGVRFQFGKWHARIKGKYLGSFENPEDAARSYDQAARILFGNNAVCNLGEQR